MALLYTFVQVFGHGRLAISSRPKIKEVKNLASNNCDRLVTILAPTGEMAHKIGIEAERYGIKWDWLKVSTACHMTREEKLAFRKEVHSVYHAIVSNESVLVHCSAGLHRTGMFAYAVLRMGHVPHDAAMDHIREMRAETFEALKEEKYINWAEGLY